LHTLFDLLMLDSDDEGINIDQFIRGCVRLRYQVKNIDMMAAIHDLERHSDKGFARICKALEKLESNNNSFRRHTHSPINIAIEHCCSQQPDSSSSSQLHAAAASARNSILSSL